MFKPEVLLFGPAGSVGSQKPSRRSDPTPEVLTGFFLVLLALGQLADQNRSR